MLISKFVLKNYWDLNTLILKFVLKKSHIKSFMINGLNFCYSKYTNVNKIIWVGSVNNKYLY